MSFNYCDIGWKNPRRWNYAFHRSSFTLFKAVQGAWLEDFSGRFWPPSLSHLCIKVNVVCLLTHIISGDCRNSRQFKIDFSSLCILNSKPWNLTPTQRLLYADMNLWPSLDMRYNINRKTFQTNMLLQVLEHKWKTPRGQNKTERRRYLIVLIKCFKALNISPPQAALTEFSALLRSFRDARHSSTIFQMIRSERAEPRRRGRCWHHSRLIPAERQLARVPRRQEQVWN